MSSCGIQTKRNLLVHGQLYRPQHQESSSRKAATLDDHMEHAKELDIVVL